MITGIQTALTAALQMIPPNDSIVVVGAQSLVSVSPSVERSLSPWFLSWAQQTGTISSYDADQSRLADQQVTREGAELFTNRQIQAP